MKIHTITSIIIAWMLVSCNEDTNTEQVQTFTPLTFSVALNNTTTRDEGGEPLTEGDIIDDKIDISIEDNIFTYTYTSDGWRSPTPYIYKGTKEVDFHANALYNKNDSTVTLPEGYDMLHADATGSPTANKGAVTFTFKHVMSKLSISIDCGEMSLEDIEEFSLEGLQKDATFDPITGEFTFDSSQSSYADIKDYTKTYILAPQEATVTVSIKIGGVVYTTPSFFLELKPGESHTCNLVIK